LEKKELDSRSRVILYLLKNKNPSSYSEIAEKTGLHSRQAAYKIIQGLIKDGLIRKDDADNYEVIEKTRILRILDTIFFSIMGKQYPHSILPLIFFSTMLLYTIARVPTTNELFSLITGLCLFGILYCLYELIKHFRLKTQLHM